MPDRKNALIISYSEVNKDPRVRNQIAWLVQAGYKVHLVGRGTSPSGITGNYWQVRRWPLPVRLFSYLLLNNHARYKFLMDFWLQKDFFKQLNDYTVDLVIINTLDYLPWLSIGRGREILFEAKVVLDLHEYSPSQGVGIVWKLMFKKYQNWLITHIANRHISARTTVAPGIAKLYAREFDIAEPEVIFNVPPYEELTPQPTNPKSIKLVHHGKADNARGLPLLVEAMNMTNSNFSLTFMLVGSKSDLLALKHRVEQLGLEDKVFFREPVKMHKVASALNEFDAEIIFFPPVTENYKHTLPNKYFEAVQARIGVVTGMSEEIIAVSDPYNNCQIAEGWTSQSLAEAINNLDQASLDKMKSGSHVAAQNLNFEVEGKKFLQMIEAL